MTALNEPTIATNISQSFLFGESDMELLVKLSKISAKDLINLNSDLKFSEVVLTNLLKTFAGLSVNLLLLEQSRKAVEAQKVANKLTS